MTSKEMASRILEDMHNRASIYATKQDHDEIDKRYKGYLNRVDKATLETIYSARFQADAQH